LRRKKKRLRLRAISQSRNRYPKGNRTNPTHAPETPISETVRAESRAPSAPNTPADPDLALIVAQWPNLPEHIRQAVLALVRAG
jgi:hypothetical protein